MADDIRITKHIAGGSVLVLNGRDLVCAQCDGPVAIEGTQQNTTVLRCTRCRQSSRVVMEIARR